MKAEMKAAYQPEVLREAKAIFGLDSVSESEFIKGFESLVFWGQKSGQAWILKLYHESHRSLEEIASELEWIRFLGRRGLRVPGLLPSQNQQLFEILSQGFVGVCFEKLKGELFQVNHITPAFLRILGEIYALMHLAAQEVHEHLASPLIRPQWYENPKLNFESALPPTDFEILGIAQETKAELLQLPKAKQLYGLIHGDLHSGNFFVDTNALIPLHQIQIFDFDDSEFHWFANDLAIGLYYFLLKTPPQEHIGLAQRFLTSVKQGYQLHAEWPSPFDTVLPLFMRWRDLLVYNLMQQIAAEHCNDPAFQGAMQARRQRILSRDAGCFQGLSKIFRWF